MRVPARHKMPLTAGSGEAQLSSSVSSWLGHELELRGIDAVIYTRYIVSILLQDDLQFDLQDADFFPHFKKGGAAGGVSSKATTPSAAASGVAACNGEKGSKGKGRGKKGDMKRRSAELDSEKIKKSAAVECLLSVTDEDSGIVTLVDELYMKLKEQQAQTGAAASASAPTPSQSGKAASDNYESCDSVISTSPEDPAERYYAAFPALSDKAEELKPVPSSKNSSNSWAKLAQKSATSPKPKSNSGSDADEFPDTVHDFEKLERDVKKAEALQKAKVMDHAHERHMQPNQERRQMGQRQSHERRSRGYADDSEKWKRSPPKRGAGGYGASHRKKVSPKERVIEQIKLTVDQIKGKAIFQDVEPDTSENITSPVHSQRLSHGNSGHIAFVVPKVRGASSRMAARLGKDPTPKDRYAERLTRVPAVHVSRESSEEKSSGDEEVRQTFGSADRENLLWYMGPLDVMMPTSPVPKDRLYNRCQSEQEEIVKFVRCILSAMESETSGSSFKSDQTLEVEAESTGSESRADTPVTEAIHETKQDLTEEFVESVMKLAQEDTLNEFSFPWEQEAIDNLLEEIRVGNRSGASVGAEEDEVKMSRFGVENKKSAECDSGNETDDQEGDSHKHEVSGLNSKKAAITEGVSLVENNNNDKQEEDEEDVSLPAAIFPWLLDLESSEADHDTTCQCGEYASCSGPISPSSDLCLSPKAVLASNQTGIPTPQSTENEVLDDRPVFSISDTDSVASSSGHTKQTDISLSPEISSPNLAGVAYLWSEDTAECTCNTEPTAAVDSNIGSSGAPMQSVVTKDDDTLICDITSSHHLHPGVLDSPYSSLCTLLHAKQQWSTADAFSGTKHKWPMWGASEIWGYPLPSIWSCDLYDTSFMAWGNRCSVHTLLSQLSVDSLSPPRASPFSPHLGNGITPSFSPHLGNGLTSHIWDIKAQRRASESPPERSGSLEKAGSSLWGLGWGREPSPSSVLMSSKLYQLEELWNLEIATASGSQQIWHSALFDPTQLMKNRQGFNSCDMWAGLSLEPIHLFRNCSLSSVDSTDAIEATLPTSNWQQRWFPSENSAFKDRIPRRLPYLPHVHSEPILSPNKCDSEAGNRRMVEVKHLYKSDTSILRELGLASDSDDETVEGNSEIEYSPDRHFHPIKTPFQASANTAAASKGASCLSSRSSSEALSSTSSTSTSYQLYQGDETINVSFIPRFKLHKEMEKSAQTGESPAIEECLDEDHSVTERLLSDMRRVLTIEEEEQEITAQDLDNLCEVSQEMVVLPDDSLPRADLASLWKDSDVDPPSIEEAAASQTGPGSYKSIWSCDPNIPSLPPDLTTCPPVASDAADSARHLSLEHDSHSLQPVTGSLYTEALGPEPDLQQDYGSLANWSTICDHMVEDTLPQGLEEEWTQHQDLDEVFSEDNAEFHLMMFPGEIPNIPQAHMLSDLENTWLNSNQQFEVQVPGKRPRGRSGTKKPCTFFMEGKCRRSDCKFAHDMSSITCRFWEEGACFKGITCPFLHGYPGESSPSSVEEEIEPQFILDGDDFPDLVASQEERPCRPCNAEGPYSSKRRKLSKRSSECVENDSHTHGKNGYTSTHKRNKGHKDKSRNRSLPIDIKFKQKASL